MIDLLSPEQIRMSALTLAIHRYPEYSLEVQIEIARKIAAFYFGETVTCH